MNDLFALSREDLVQMYRTMILIRHFEETAIAYSKQGHVIGNMHMYVGEEAVATGICKALTKDDYVASTHRCDGHLIAKGADINKMMAELMGKATGNCGGRAGKMHQCAPEVGLLSANGIVGASETLATGHALYCSMFAPGRISVAFFGDGGGNQGAEPTVATDPVPTGPRANLYWNLDRALYDGKSEAGMSSRKPASDGYFHVRFFKDGEMVKVKVTEVLDYDLVGKVVKES